MVEAITPPSRTGYTFQGYYTSTGGGGTKYYNANGTGNGNWNIAGDTTLYAYWTPNTYTVYYHDNYGTDAIVDRETITYNSAFYCNPCSVSRPGYHFIKWTENPTGVNSPNWDGWIDKAWTYTYARDLHLYAQWEANTYTVTFDGNGGIIKIKDQPEKTTKIQSFTYDSSQRLDPNEFVKVGYYFEGWATSKSGTKVYSDQQVVLNLTPNYNGNFTLYAVWSPTIVSEITGIKPDLQNGSYIINSVENLVYLISNHTTGSYKQTRDLDLGGRIWYPIGTTGNQFKGVYNGQGYVIKNLTIPNDDCIHSNVGLFGVVDGSSSTAGVINGIIENVYINNAEIHGRDNVGVLIGKGINAKVNNCMIENSKVSASSSCGALIGNASDSSTIKNCLINITCSSSLNGIYGGSATVENCLLNKNNEKSQIGTNFKSWGKIGNNIIPSKEWAWVSLVPVEDNKVSSSDIQAWLAS